MVNPLLTDQSDQSRIKKEHISSYIRYFQILEKAKNRLLAQGYKIVDGEIIPDPSKKIQQP